MKNIRGVVGHYGMYDYDISTIKKMRNIYKVSNLKAVRISGLEDDRKFSAKCTVNKNKLLNNLSRAKSKLKEYVLCNDWDYFMTFTIDKNKYDRFNLKLYYKDFSKFIQNYNRYCDNEHKVKYIFVPEMHSDGAWHIHGFLKGIKECDITINVNGYMTWKQYNDKFGFISFDKIRDINKSANYILKYITKDSAKGISELNCHLYYCSKSLNVAETVYKGKITMLEPWDYTTEDGFCKLKYFDSENELEKGVIFND